MEEIQKDVIGQALIDELKRSNELTIQLIKVKQDWKLAMRNGIMAGFGSVVGATVVVSIIIQIMQPLKQLEILKPSLDKIGQELERRPGGKV